jgi:hypothetical protein
VRPLRASHRSSKPKALAAKFSLRQNSAAPAFISSQAAPVLALSLPPAAQAQDTDTPHRTSSRDSAAARSATAARACCSCHSRNRSRVDIRLADSSWPQRAGLQRPSRGAIGAQGLHLIELRNPRCREWRRAGRRNGNRCRGGMVSIVKDAHINTYSD